MSATRTGRCLCGAVQFVATNAGTDIGVCHCRMCQRWTGLALMALTVREADLAITGSEHVMTYASSDWATRSWCGKCGSNLWYRITADGPHKGNYEIPIGLFNDPDGFTLRRELFADRRPDAYRIAGDHAQLTEAEVIAMFSGGGS
jgi:hypothetical protein